MRHLITSTIVRLSSWTLRDPGRGDGWVVSHRPSDDKLRMLLRDLRGPPKIPSKIVVQTVGSGHRRGEGDGVTEPFQLVDVAALETGAIQLLEIVGAQIRIGLVVTQQVVEDHQDAVRHR